MTPTTVNIEYWMVQKMTQDGSGNPIPLVNPDKPQAPVPLDNPYYSVTCAGGVTRQAPTPYFLGFLIGPAATGLIAQRYGEHTAVFASSGGATAGAGGTQPASVRPVAPSLEPALPSGPPPASPSAPPSLAVPKPPAPSCAAAPSACSPGCPPLPPVPELPPTLDGDGERA